ncbi:DUF4197 domain-containing protein [Flammeovirgaceae bacterium SG7u.111]|nr:DUF4197 domain-containing protein [Flammeovirgaceae bacterium SG7u.132]WPO38266.1 DUF4197 domain-containing protein [Flammeovirgaceae bacterium SG7u.111]
MRKSIYYLLFTLFLLNTIPSQAQFLKDLKKSLTKGAAAAGFTEEEAGAAIKQALEKGVVKGVELVAQENGFFADSLIKIPFPAEAKLMEQKLRMMGMDKQVDQVILTFNRAAEDASIKAKDIFVGAIKEMTLTDAINIVKGEEDAATQYLQNHTTSGLVTEFSPIIDESLDKVLATKYWEELVTTYNKLPFVRKVNPNLTEYVTEKAIEGLFVKVADEEKLIRENPAERTTELLEKVFGKK